MLETTRAAAAMDLSEAAKKVTVVVSDAMNSLFNIFNAKFHVLVVLEALVREKN